MPVYSIAQAKDRLSKLIDEAVAGESVTITRHGKPVVELRPSAEAAALRAYNEQDWGRVRARREARPPLGEDSVLIIRAMRDDAL